MPQVVEVAWIPVKEGEGSAAAEAVKGQAEKFISSTPGLEHVYRGKVQGEDKLLHLVHVWDSDESRQKARSSPEAEEARKAFEPLIDTGAARPPHLSLVAFDKPFDAVASAPFVNFTGSFVDMAHSKADFEAAFRKAMESQPKPEGFIAATEGWGDEDVELPEKPGQKMRVWVAVSGWTGADALKTAHAGAEAQFAPLRDYVLHHEQKCVVYHKEK